MSTSRSVDRLTYTYYTGQDGSEPNGPNCHKCMNELFHENKLLDVQMVFITTPSGLIPFTTRSLVYSYGMETPYSMTLSTEDFLVASCTQCAQKAIRLELSDAMKAYKEGAAKKTKKRRKNKAKVAADLDISSSSPMAKKSKSQQKETCPSPTNSVILLSNNSPLEGREEMVGWSYQIYKDILLNGDSLPANPCIEDCHDNNYNLPFLHGRNPNEVKDPMSDQDRILIERFMVAALPKWDEMIDRISAVTGFYFANQEIVTCNYCDSNVSKSTYNSDEGFLLITHLVSGCHFKNVALAGLVYSYSEDLKKFLELSNLGCKEAATTAARIPFVSETRTEGKGMRFEKLFNCFSFLKWSGSIDDGFSQYMLRIYPNIKDIHNCFLCDCPVSFDQTAFGYFNHFLSFDHIAKAVKNNWKLGCDFGKIISHLTSYLKEEGRAEFAVSLVNQLTSAAHYQTYSAADEKYKHLFEMDEENNQKKNGK